jgi:hypothetical protein
MKVNQIADINIKIIVILDKIIDIINKKLLEYQIKKNL